MSDTGDGKRGGSSLKAMLSFFTVIRTPVDRDDLDAMEKRFWLIPLIGLLVGQVAYQVCWASSYCGFSPPVQAVSALAAAMVFSKFIHLDGLIDFGDGMICSSADREKHVRALKDTLVGAGGVGVGVVVTVLAAVLYSDAGMTVAPYVPEHAQIAVLALCCEVLAKNAQVAAAAAGRPGTGMASRQVSMTGAGSAAKSSVLSLLLVLAAVAVHLRLMDISVTDADWLYFAVPVAGLFASVLAGAVVARTANRAFGFVNGDILGASNEISRLFVLVAAAVSVHFGAMLRWTS